MEIKKVLLIEDEDLDSVIFSKMLFHVGLEFKLQVKNNGRSALAYLNGISNSPSDWPTHIFVDINMPYLNGFQFIEKYLEYPESLISISKMYILSSSSNPDDRKKAKDYKIVSKTLPKPITVKELQRLLNLD